jgi:hypothetical protein
MDGGDAAAPGPRKSAVQMLQEQLKKELDDKEKALVDFKEKTRLYIAALKKKHDEDSEKAQRELEGLQQQMVRERDSHATELMSREAAHKQELAARDTAESATVIKALEADNAAAARALADAQARLQAAQGAASQIHVLRGELEQERRAKEAAEKELAKARAAGAPAVAASSSASVFDPLSALSAAAAPSHLSGAFAGFAGFTSALTGSGDPSTSIFGGSAGGPSSSLFGSSADDPSTSLFGSSASEPPSAAPATAPDLPHLDALQRRVAELEESLQDATAQLALQNMQQEPPDLSEGAHSAQGEALRQAQDEAQAAHEQVSTLQEKLCASLVKAEDAKRALEADKSELALRVDALQAEVLELRQKAAAGNGAKAAADDGGWGDAWGDDAGGGGLDEQVKEAEKEVARLLKELERTEAGISRLEEEAEARDEAMRAQAERVEALVSQTRLSDAEIHKARQALAECQAKLAVATAAQQDCDAALLSLRREMQAQVAAHTPNYVICIQIYVYTRARAHTHTHKPIYTHTPTYIICIYYICIYTYIYCTQAVDGQGGAPAEVASIRQELDVARAEAMAAREEARVELEAGKVQSREMLKRAVEAKKLLQGKLHTAIYYVLTL